MTAPVHRWLVAEFCGNALFNGWHLYLRDTDRHQRNADGDWGWLQRGHHLLQSAHAALAELGILMRPGGDGTCDDDGHAELARRYPIRRSRLRGGVPIQIVGGSITALTAPAATPQKARAAVSQSRIIGAVAWTGDAMAYALAHVEAGVLRVDDDGSIWRARRRHTRRHGEWISMAPRRVENLGGKGYWRVSLHVPELGSLAIVMAHRLVYEVKVGPIPDGLEINHKDLDKQNNRPDNLETVTGAQNTQHSYANGHTRPWSTATIWRPGRAVLTSEAKATARQMRSDKVSLKDIAAQLGISVSHAHRITRGEAQPLRPEGGQ